MVHGLLALGAASVLVWPYASAGSSLLLSLGKYSRFWRFNETLFAPLSWLTGSQGGGVRLSGLVVLTLAVALAWRRVEAASAGLTVVSAWLLLAPNVLPWYALWLLPFLVLREVPGRSCSPERFSLPTSSTPAGSPANPGTWGGDPGPGIRSLRPGGAEEPVGGSPVNPDLLLVFVKEPSPGQVKTRLAQAIGAKAAAELYRLLTEEVLRRTAPAGSEYRRLLFFAPPQAGPAMAAWLPGETLVEQVEGDIGARMAGAFEEAFRRGAQRALLIGTDVPGLSRELLIEGFASLEDHDLVLGPAQDGGYYLLGLDRPQPALFGASPGARPRFWPPPWSAPVPWAFR